MHVHENVVRIFFWGGGINPFIPPPVSTPLMDRPEIENSRRGRAGNATPPTGLAESCQTEA